MASILFRMGRWCYQRAWRVIVGWLVVLGALGGAAAAFGGSFDDTFSIPSAQSQEALSQLRMTFPEAADLSASAVVVVPDGVKISDPEVLTTLVNSGSIFEGLPHVTGVVTPGNEFISGLVAADDQAAIVQIRLDLKTATPADLVELTAAGEELQAQLPAGSTVTMGGEAYSIELPHLSITEALGVVVAIIVLMLVLGSLIAAGMPILTALVGVGITMSVMLLMTTVTTISSTTPMLAVMLGLAVGIDYALFIMSRHREQLRDPKISAIESTARSVATAGSAVVFAGATVVIALLGLGLANVPFLTVMGAFASLGVLLAVLIALTMLPALMGLAGERLRPRARSEAKTKTQGRFLRGWVQAAIKWPWVTVIVIVVLSALAMLPARNLHLALPDSGQHAATASDRIAYDQIGEHFGPGYNGPLIVTVDLLASNDPVALMDDIKADVEKLPGVASVPVATPNPNADTGFVQVVPTTGPSDVATQDLVNELRAQESTWLERYGVATAVTGVTAVQIDISDRLAAALWPFGLFVVGLSLILLTIVFRSIAVPIKAAVGYLLSVGVAFGVTAWVFNEGNLANLVNIEGPQPIISFLPILLMGILFGLAMDYEVFLVSRMREEYVHGKSARDAIVEGFIGSGAVVAAAAVIMFAVFAFFVPEGMGPVKTIAFSLAVGIAMDAFVVRMTFVPAVLAILGDKAWWLPKWLARRMPSLDVEGERLAKELALEHWPGTTDLVYLDALAAEPVVGPLSLAIPPTGVVAIQGEDERRAALLLISGRLAATSGRARVGGALLPEQAAQARTSVGYLDVKQTDSVSHELRSALARGTRVVCIDNADLTATAADRNAIVDLIAAARLRTGIAVVLGGANPGVLTQLNPDSIVAVRSASYAS